MSNGIDGALAFVVGGSCGLGRDLASALHDGTLRREDLTGL